MVRPLGEVFYRKMFDESGNELVLPIGAAPFRGCLVNLTANQNVAHGGIVAILFTGADIYDTDSIHNPAVNPGNLVVPVGVTFVRLSGRVTFQTAVGNRQSAIYKAGGAFVGGCYWGTTYTVAAGYSLSMQHVSAVVPVVAGDTFQLYAMNNTGAPQPVLANETWFQMEIIQ